MSLKNNVNRFPITRPQQKQKPIDINDTTAQKCPQCSGQYFNTCIKLRILSKLNPKNQAGKDVLIKVVVYLCHNCGHEYGQPVVKNN